MIFGHKIMLFINSKTIFGVSNLHFLMEELWEGILLYHPSELYSFYFRITPEPFSSKAEK